MYLDRARAGRDESLGATAWLMTAGMAENHGNFDEMRVSAIEAVDRFRALGERWGLSMALRTIGNIQVLDGDLDGAIAAFTEASRWHGCPCGGPSPATGAGAETGPRKTATLKCADSPISLGHVFPWRCLGSCRSPADLRVPSAPDQKDCSSTKGGPAPLALSLLPCKGAGIA